MDLTNVIDGIEQRAAASIKAEQGDYYGDDGLLYCGKCSTPKECRYELFGEMRTSRCLCKCREERYKREMEKVRSATMYQNFTEYSRTATDFELLKWIDSRDYTICEQIVNERQKLLKRICFPSGDMSQMTFENDDRANEKVSKIMKNYADNFETMKTDGKGILLFGEVGRGKSYLACCVGNALIEKGIPVLMTDFEWIEKKSGENYAERQKFFDTLNEFPLLIVDDLGVERNTPYMNSIVYTVIDNRVKAGLPIIVTTNLTANELKNPAEMTNQRIYSRLLGACIPVEVTGVDRRREALKEAHAVYKDILGY